MILALNIILMAAVFSAVVGTLAWAITSSRPARPSPAARRPAASRPHASLIGDYSSM